MRVRLLADTNVPPELMENLHREIPLVFPQLQWTSTPAVLSINDAAAYTSHRCQHDGLVLLKHARAHADLAPLFLYVVSDDMYGCGRTFVYGLAMHRVGAVVSLARLDRPHFAVRTSLNGITADGGDGVRA